MLGDLRMMTTETLALVRRRQVERQVTWPSTSDGAVVKLRRVLTADLQQRLDPFL